MRDYSKLTKPTPDHFCAYCGKKMERKRFPKGKPESIKLFLRRKYCDRECMRRAFVKQDAKNQRYGESHHSARKITYLIQGKEKVCEICGSTKSIDVHHKDGDYNNNNVDNLMIVCRSCHMKIHRPQKTCSLCGKPVKGHGYCNMHYIRWKKFGDPLTYYGKIVADNFFQERAKTINNK